MVSKTRLVALPAVCAMVLGAVLAIAAGAFPPTAPALTGVPAADARSAGFVWQVGIDYSKAQNQPLRRLAEGRNSVATIDAENAGFGKNDGDNEITGLLVPDGDIGTHGILSAKLPDLSSHGWRWFYTRQHGDNATYEVHLSRHSH